MYTIELSGVLQWLLVGKREAICKQMKCWNTTKNACVAKAEQRAYEKTTCGNNKWCIQGECVHDVHAPSAFCTHTAIVEISQIHAFDVFMF